MYCKYCKSTIVSTVNLTEYSEKRNQLKSSQDCNIIKDNDNNDNNNIDVNK